MYQYTMSLDGESVGIQSNMDLSLIFARWKNLPHLTDISVSPGGKHEYIVEYTNAIGNEVRYSEKLVRVTMQFAKLGTGELLLYAALPFLEVLHQRKQVITMHAAAVEFAGKAVLLLGKAGAGKTSLTLSLCRNHRAQLIGNDIVKLGLVDNGVNACAGSKYFFLRQESIKRNIPDLLSLFPQSEKDSWTNKVYCLPNKLGIDTCDGHVPISHSYLVHVDETMDDLYIMSADKMDTRLYLNEDMSRYIRGTAISLFGEESHLIGYVPSYDTPDFFSMRVRLTESLISNTDMMYVSGSLHDICKHIVSKVEVLRQA